MSEIADFALASDSPCRYDNRTEVSNPLFPSNRLELPTIGAWTYFNPDFTDPQYVLIGHTTNNIPGTFDEASRNTDPGVANVLKETEYKILDVELEGEYDPTVVTIKTPILEAENRGDGVVNISLTNTDATQLNTIYYAEENVNLEWIELISFNDNKDISHELGSGIYYIYATSTLNTQTAISEVYRVKVTNYDAESANTDEAQYIKDEGEYIQIQKNDRKVTTTTGTRVNSYTTHKYCWAWYQPLSGADIIRYEKRGIYVSGKVFTAIDPEVEEGDRLVFKNKTFRVQSNVNQAGKSTLYRIDVAEEL
jgi:hypothetical protein